MEKVLPILVIVAVVATLAVLAVGIIAMLRGGEFNRKYGNRLMRLRVLMQLIAIGLIGIAFLVLKR
ncbi:MAG: twin transmembrane helix small protein [Alphaproteobacteria bacterium]|nr:twin transmembrane helix small protein [Alphaproteobacteria bacterium]